MVTTSKWGRKEGTAASARPGLRETRKAKARVDEGEIQHIL